MDKKKRVHGDQQMAWPKAEEDVAHAVASTSTALDAARDDEKDGGGDAGDTLGTGSREATKEVSLTDTQATLGHRPGVE